MVADSVNNDITLTVGFRRKIATFEISQAAQLSQNSGLSLMVKVPEAYLTQVKQGKRETSIETLYSSISGVPIGTRYTDEDHFLYICRTTDLNDYGNAGMKLSWGSMYHGSPGECIEPDTIEAEPLSEEFLSRGMDVFSLGLPTNAEQEVLLFCYDSESNANGRGVCYGQTGSGIVFNKHRIVFAELLSDVAEKPGSWKSWNATRALTDARASRGCRTMAGVKPSDTHEISR